MLKSRQAWPIGHQPQRLYMMFLLARSSPLIKIIPVFISASPTPAVTDTSVDAQRLFFRFQASKRA